MKYAFLSVVATLLLGAQAEAMNHADVHLSHISPTKEESIWLREKQFTPMYPKELAMQGIAGCGIFNVHIDKDGHTDSVNLIRSIPKKGIAKPASKVIKSWKWVTHNGKAKAAEDRIIRLDFCMGGATQEEAQQLCAAQALLACEG